MATDQALLVQLIDLMGQQLGALNQCCQQLNSLLAELRGEVRALRETMAGGHPSKWQVLEWRIPRTGILAPNSVADEDIPLPTGIKAFYINALWLIATAQTRCNLYVYNDTGRAEAAVVFFSEDIIVPTAPADGIRVLNTARLDINPIGAPGILWENRGLAEVLPVRVRNQTAAAGGANAAFQLLLWYTPVMV